MVLTSNTGPILVFPWIHPFGCDVESSLGRVYSRQVTALKLSKNTTVFRHEILSHFTTCTNPASIHNLLTLLYCESDLIRSSYCCHRI